MVQYDKLPVGSVVLQGRGKTLVNSLMWWRMGTPWTHAFVVLDHNTGIEASVSKGVVLFDLRQRFEELEREGRAVVVMDHPDFSPDDVYKDRLRHKMADRLRSDFIGKKYDHLQWILFGLFRIFWFDSPNRIICTRLVTAGFQKIHMNVFSKETQKTIGSIHRYNGYCIPSDLLNSDLRVILSVQGKDDLAVRELPKPTEPHVCQEDCKEEDTSGYEAFRALSRSGEHNGTVDGSRYWRQEL